MVLLVVACEAPDPTPAPAPSPHDAAVSLAPPRPSQAPVIQLAVGTWHTCALHADHTVSCWGDNASGELAQPKGRRPLLESATPLAVPGIHDAIELGATDHVTCVRHGDRTVSCWGEFERKATKAEMLANLTGSAPATHTHEPFEPTLLPIADVVQLKGDCMRTASAEVYCLAPTRQLVRIADVADAVDIGGDLSSGCIVRAQGKLWCWQPGLPFSKLDDLDDIVQVDASTGALGGFWCARTAAGKIVCRDLSLAAVLRRKDGSKPVVHLPQAALVEGVDHATELVVGNQRACAIDGGALSCWDGTAVVAHPLAGTGFTAMAAGLHTCVARGHDVTCWGTDEKGELGSGWSSRRTTPIQVPGITDAIAVWTDTWLGPAKGDRACALGRTGVVSCWGDNYDSAAPHPLPLHDIVSLGTGRELLAIDRAGHAWLEKHQLKVPPVVAGTWECVLSAAGVVACRDMFLAMGTDPIIPKNPKLGELMQVPALAGAVQIASSSDVCARGRDGSVRCYQQFQKGVPPIDDAIDLAMGTRARCVVRADHSVWCWDLFDGTLLAPAPSDAVPARKIPELDAVAGISVGENFACARHQDGGVSCWGANDMGQLGDGTLEPRQTPHRIAGLTNVVAIATGADFACAVLAAGTVQCWGASGDGQVGTHDAHWIAEPQQVTW
jgi:alpha-tubulin suppressor-like RCC1 family protein